jgi:hypothetical protein
MLVTSYDFRMWIALKRVELIMRYARRMNALDDLLALAELQRTAGQFVMRVARGDELDRGELEAHHSRKVAVFERLASAFPGEGEFTEGLREAREQLAALRDEP